MWPAIRSSRRSAAPTAVSASNPFCAAYPRPGKPPLVLDFATSTVAYGKTRVAYNQRKQVPAGALVDHEGVPTADPKVMHEAPFGSLTPFGGHKGFGLAAMCEIFSGALAGGFTTHADTLGTTNAIINCMLALIVDRPRSMPPTRKPKPTPSSHGSRLRRSRWAPSASVSRANRNASRARSAKPTGVPVDAANGRDLCVGTGRSA